MVGDFRHTYCMNNNEIVMKTTLMFCLAIVMTIAASAQRYSKRNPPRVRSSISIGIGTPFYQPYYSPYRSRPFYGTPGYIRPSRLDLEIADIKADYNDRIWSVRHDKSVSKSRRKAEIRRLKSERDRAIRDAQFSYHRRRY